MYSSIAKDFRERYYLEEYHDFEHHTYNDALEYLCSLSYERDFVISFLNTFPSDFY